MRKFKMLAVGSTRGAVTGKNHVWEPGRVIIAPAGEFKHLSKGAFEDLGEYTPPPAPETATAPGAPEKAVKPKAEKR